MKRKKRNIFEEASSEPSDINETSEKTKTSIRTFEKQSLRIIYGQFGLCEIR